MRCVKFSDLFFYFSDILKQIQKYFLLSCQTFHCLPCIVSLTNNNYLQCRYNYRQLCHRAISMSESDKDDSDEEFMSESDKGDSDEEFNFVIERAIKKRL